MKRRTFLKAAAAAGLTVVSPLASREAKAQATGLHAGPFFMFIQADGGWDPTHLCDPKGDVEGMNRYPTDAIGMAGNIAYAPVDNHQAFFEKHNQRLMVVNGIDMSTNGHEQGRRYTWSGKLNEGNPSLAAMIAAKLNPALPMAYITNGGYDETNGIVGATRAERVDTIPKIAYTNRINPNNENTFHSDFAAERIKAASDARLEARMAATKLSRRRKAMDALHTARLGEAELKEVLQYLPEDLNNNNGLINQAQVALAAFKAGLGVSVTMRMGGFDTHNDHDNRHIPRLGRILEALDFIFDEAERMQIVDQLFVGVGSDFGRTPGYNGNNGKDHWSINSMMLMGHGVPGNTVIGETDPRHRPMSINPDTLETDENGIRIRPEHVHAAIRRLAGVERSPLALQFPVNVETELDLFRNG